MDQLKSTLMFYFSKLDLGIYLKNFKIKLKNKSLFLDLKLDKVNLSNKLFFPITKFLTVKNKILPLGNQKGFTKGTKLFNFFYFRSWVMGSVFGFHRRIFIKGMGFKFRIVRDKLVIKLGLSYDLVVPVPTNAKIYVRKPTEIEVFSTCFSTVNRFSYLLLRSVKLNPYTLKGVFFFRQVTKRKLSSKLAK